MQRVQEGKAMIGMSAQQERDKEHERKIAEVREEIFEIKEEIEGYFQDHRLRVILERILAREEAALADLLRGWREKGDGNGQR